MSSAASRSPSPDQARPGWLAAGGLFLLLGFAVNAVVITVWVDWTLVWADLLHHNPDRPVSNALVMLALSPFGGVLVALVLAPLAVLTGAIVMAILIRFLGALPFWTVVPVIPLCIFAAALQSHLSSHEPWTSATGDPRIVAAQIPFVLGCWVFYRALAKSQASPERAKLRRRILHLAAALIGGVIVAIAGATLAVHRKPWQPEISWSQATGLPKIIFVNEWRPKERSGFVSWSPDGTEILTLSVYCGWLTVQDSTGRVAQEKRVPIPSTFHFVVNAQEVILPGKVGSDVAFYVADVASGRVVFQEHTPQLGRPNLDQAIFALSHDGSVLAAAHSLFPGQPISLYDTRTWQKLDEIDVPAAERGVRRLTFSADGSKLAFETSGNLVVIDAHTGRSVSAIPIDALGAGAFAFSPDNSMVAVEKIVSKPDAFVPNGVAIFRLSDGAEIASHAPPYLGPNCSENAQDCGLSRPILWDPAGRFLVFPDGYHTIRIWNPFVGNGEDATIRTRYFQGAIALSPDGGKLAIGNGDFVSIFHMGG